MPDFGAPRGAATVMALLLMCTTLRVGGRTPVRIVPLFVCAVPPLGGAEMAELPNADLTGCPCQHSVCCVLAEDDAFKKHY